MTKYNVECKPVKADKNGNRDWQPVDDGITSRSKAVKLAKSKSKLKECDEAHVCGWDDPCDDPEFDRYYKNGKLNFTMI